MGTEETVTRANRRASRLTGVWAVLLLTGVLLPGAADSVEDVRREIVASYQSALDALARGDADEALKIDTPDWVSITAGEKPRPRAEIEPLVRRAIGSMKPPPGWVASWRPDYERSGTTSGIQVYDVRTNGDAAIVLCLVGNSRNEVIDGTPHVVWTGSHVRDTWVKTTGGWKRRMHEKLTVNERLVDGKTAKP